jgi:hypothetical protein
VNYEFILKSPEIALPLSSTVVASALDRFAKGESGEAFAAYLKGLQQEPLGEVESTRESTASLTAVPKSSLSESEGVSAPHGPPPATSEERPIVAVMSTSADGRAQIEISVSFEPKEELAKACFDRTFSLAEGLGLEVFDPQLNRLLSSCEVERAIDKWNEMRGYLLRSQGLDSLLIRHEPLTLPPPSFVERHWKLIAVGVGILFFVLILHRLLQLHG